MKIAFFMSTVLEQGGGMEKYLIEAADYLSKYPEVQVDVITIDDKFTSRLINFLSWYYFRRIDTNNMHTASLELIKKRLGKAGYFKCGNLHMLKKTLQKYDVIYAKNELLDSLILGVLLGYNQLPPIIFGVHTPIYFPEVHTVQAKLHNLLYRGIVYKFLLKGASAIHVINAVDKRECEKLFPTKKIFKIVNPFRYKDFTRNNNDYIYNFKLDKKKYNIFWLGRLTEEKGIDELFEIISSLNATTYADKITWNIAGDGDYKGRVLELMNNYKNINYFGHVENRYVANILANINLFISTSHYETFGYTIAEAQSMNVPVLSFETAGAQEIIIPNQTGMIVRNRGQFVRELIKFVNGGNIFKRINRQMRLKFNPEVIYDQLFKMFQVVCDNKSARKLL